jgi:sulfatase modifying factor 1
MMKKFLMTIKVAALIVLIQTYAQTGQAQMAQNEFNADSWWGEKKVVVDEPGYLRPYCVPVAIDVIEELCSNQADDLTDNNNEYLFNVLDSVLLESSVRESGKGYMGYTCYYSYQYQCQFEKTPFALERQAYCTNDKPNNSVWTTNGPRWNQVNVNSDGSFSQRWQTSDSTYHPSVDTCQWTCDEGYGAMDGQCHKLDSSIIGSYVDIKAGTFTMGSPANEECRRDKGEELHQVTLTHDFEMQSHEVTRAQFEQIMGYNMVDRQFNDDNLPANRATWHEAAAYCNALSDDADKCYTCEGSGNQVKCETKDWGPGFYECPGYRLPTEAEWEYAYRAGSNTMYYDANVKFCESNESDGAMDLVGWYAINSGEKPHPVGMKSANTWGLYDMGGMYRSGLRTIIWKI